MVLFAAVRATRRMTMNYKIFLTVIWGKYCVKPKIPGLMWENSPAVSVAAQARAHLRGIDDSPWGEKKKKAHFFFFMFHLRPRYET